MSGRAATDRVIRGRFGISVNDPGHPTPPGWVRTPLTDVADLGTGHTPSRNHPEYWDGDVPWIGIRDAGAHHGGIIDTTNQTITPLGLANSAARLLPKDTVCLSRTASVGYVVKMGRDMATSQDFVNWVCSEALDPGFLMSALLAEGEDIRKFGEGSTHTTIYFPAVKAFHIELPPVTEQRRIVAKLDTLTSHIDRARTELDRVNTHIKNQRDSLIAWYIDEATRHAPKVSFREKISVLTSGSRDWARFYDRGTSVFVLAGNVRSLKFDPVPKRFIDPPLDSADAQRSKIEKDDLLITIVGAGTGDVCRVCDHYENYFVCQSVARIALADPNLSSFYEFWFVSPRHGGGDFQEATYGAARPHLSFDQLKGFLVPNISRDAADKAVGGITKALSHIYRLEAEAARARKLLDRLESAILAKAFRGELVPQDPNDEPAGVLLERIRAERAAAPKQKRGARKGARAQ